MTAAPAAHTPPADHGWFTDTVATVWNWTASVVPGGSLTIIGAVVVVGLLAKEAGKGGSGGTKTDWKNTTEAIVGIAKSVYRAVRGLVLTLWALVRFYGGRELRGGPRSTATVLRAGTPLAKPGQGQDAPAVSMESVAASVPRVSLVKTAPRREPRRWARTAATRLATYDGRGARILDRTVRVVLWAARWAARAWRLVRAVYRLARMWHCWPYAARGLARVAATALLVSALVPAWTVQAVLLGALASLPLGVLLRQVKEPAGPGDADVYGPRIWAVLRADLNLPEDEPWENWLLLPQALSDPAARITIRLPWTWRGGELDRQNLTTLVNSRVPGEWVARVTLTGETFTAVYTHKPPPRPAPPVPECPERVSFFDPDIQEAIAKCKKGQLVVGKDQFGRIVLKEMGTSETPHWALSVGTGGGKSSFCQMVIAQLISQGYYVIGVDVKRVSISRFKGVVGCYIYNDPMNVWDMRRAVKWFSEELSARSTIAEVEPNAEFPGILCLIEEANEFADISKQWWDENRKPTSNSDGPADPAADPTWGEIASAARVGRHVYGNILAVFQDLRDQALGGKGIRNLFRLKFMGNYSVNSWKNVIGTTPVPQSVDKAGRMMIVEGNQEYWIQTPFAEPEELRAWAIQAREQTGFVEGAGLFGTPPKPSPKRLPRLLERLSRDELPEALREPSEGGLSDETAGHPSHEGADVTPSGADVTPSRDRLRLVPTQGSHDAHQAAADPLAGPELLPLAEISRRLEGVAGIPKEATVRAHSTRREDFPEPTLIGKKKLYLESQIRAYYQQQQKQA